MKPTEKLEVQRFMGSIICRWSRIIRSGRFVAFGRSERPKKFSTTGVSRKKDKKIIFSFFHVVLETSEPYQPNCSVSDFVGQVKAM